jgi:hypothetical protein
MIWYDESPTWLGACVAGFARICDTIVAVDGAYALYPGARPRSHPEQAETILNTCEAMSVGCVIHRPRDVWWGNEIEKRNHSLQLARPFLTPYEDWVLIFDSDYQVMLLENPAHTRSLLENTDKNVGRYTLLDGRDLMADEWMANYAQQRPVDSDWTVQDRGIFRWTDDLEYVGRHWVVRGTYHGERQWLRGPDLSPGQMDKASPTEDMGRNLVVVHRNKERPLSRTSSAQGYYKMREAHQVETLDPSFA